MNIPYDVYRYIFIGGAIMAAVMFIVTIFLFFYLHIPSVIGDLSGSTARKAIENIRNQNESSGDKTFRSSPVNKSRGRLTDKISSSGRLERKHTDSLNGAMPTEKISTAKLANPTAEETTVLPSKKNTSEETIVLQPETVVLNSYSPQQISAETKILSSDFPIFNQETTVLSTSDMSQTAPAFQSADAVQTGCEPQSMFTIEYEITYVQSTEVVQ